MLTLLNSCQNDITEVRQATSKIDRADPHAWYFQNSKLHQGIQTRTTRYSIQDALALVNDGLNFLYCRPDDYYLETIVSLDTFHIEVDGSSEIDEVDLEELMDTIASWAGNVFYSDSRDAKEPLLFDVNQAGSPSGGQLPLEVIFYFEASAETETEDKYPYEDSWLYGQWSLNASEFCSEEEANADAADLFRRDLRKAVVFRDKFSSYYFKNPYRVCFSGGITCVGHETPLSYLFLNMDESYLTTDLENPQDITLGDNLYDYLVFTKYSGFQNYDECLTASEMNFYFESMEDLALDVLPSPIGDKVLSTLEVGYELLLIDLESVIYHIMIVTMTEKIEIENEEYEDPLELPICCP